jgi:hypothetical protein
MSAVAPGPEDVPAPRAAVGWSARDGFVSDAARLDAVRGQGAVALMVHAGMVRDVFGDAPLTAVIRLDREVAALAGEVESLHTRLLDVFESALDVLSDRRS